MIDEGRHADLLPQPPDLDGGEPGGEADDEPDGGDDAGGGAPAAAAARGGGGGGGGGRDTPGIDLGAARVGRRPPCRPARADLPVGVVCRRRGRPRRNHPMNPILF